ncbi:hypothetical protein ETB97_003329 [Aspergillus alliaceus]|uniref:Zn(2)-C6 fungal-type domain-containing protein n=1 Tax=Petromyces alliaceus TaxID=209559 RepID=A0A5N7CBS4_PETAA|nr:hypothetical protein BDV23DRAFT_182738 [Aspergillus alliaceus]KAF5859087.1 hypothetical protein ETB97_003329 [Aspergillus burnettii]
MSPRRSPVTGKQKRVRTGCWTCRRRRRKCDERKPRCENCEAKGFSCRYGADLTFVSVPNPKTRSPKETTAGAVNYNAIQFVDDGPASSNVLRNCENDQGSRSAAAPAMRATPSPIIEQPVEHDRAQAPTLNRLACFSGVDADIPRESTLPDSINSSHLEDNRGTVAKSRDLGYASGNYTSSSHLANTDNPPYLTSISETDEIGLLRYFRYNLAPWIDAGDPECGFEIQALLLAKTERPLVSDTFQEEAERGLAEANDQIRSMGQALLMLQDFCSSRPHQWRDFLLSRIRTYTRLGAVTTPQGMLNQPWWLLHFRIDLAAGIFSAKAPLMPYSSQLLPDGSFSLAPQQRPAKWVFLRALLLLADCLSLLFGQVDSSSSSESERTLAVHTLLQTDFTSRWTSIWANCQEWYHNRHVEMRPVLDIRGVEADEINFGNGSSFPILIYTTPLALLANTVYHISSFLLLNHKPRLLKQLAGPRRFASRLWHAQAIAGLAASNDFKEQWDPILIVSLLTVAPEMTHASQQSILLKQLSNITMATGIKLDCEIDTLRSGWDISQYDEDTVG